MVKDAVARAARLKNKKILLVTGSVPESRRMEALAFEITKALPPEVKVQWNRTHSLIHIGSSTIQFLSSRQIKNGWLRGLHPVAPAEYLIDPEPEVLEAVHRRLHFSPADIPSRDHLLGLVAEIRSNVRALNPAPPVPDHLVPDVSQVVTTARNLVDALERVADALLGPDLDPLKTALAAQPSALTAEVKNTPRRLRACNHLAGLYVTNIVAACREGLFLLDQTRELI